MKNVYHSMWDHEILHVDRSSKDEQLLLRQILWKTKNMNVEGGLNLISMLCFTEIPHELLHLLLENKIWYCRRSWTHLQAVFELFLYLTKFLNMTIVRNFEIMLGRTPNLFCAEFCNFAKCCVCLAYVSEKEMRLMRAWFFLSFRLCVSPQ
jgi:hypothetical protein